MSLENYEKYIKKIYDTFSTIGHKNTIITVYNSKDGTKRTYEGEWEIIEFYKKNTPFKTESLISQNVTYHRLTLYLERSSLLLLPSRNLILATNSFNDNEYDQTHIMKQIAQFAIDHDRYILINNFDWSFVIDNDELTSTITI